MKDIHMHTLHLIPLDDSSHQRNVVLVRQEQKQTDRFGNMHFFIAGLFRVRVIEKKNKQQNAFPLQSK